MDRLADHSDAVRRDTPSRRLAIGRALHERARSFVRAFELGRAADEDFDPLACDLARYQATYVPAYGRLCRARGVDPSTLVRAEAAPAVPTDAFKLARIATFPDEETRALFRTSGTTLGARGIHAMRDVATYDAGAVAFGRHWLLRDLESRIPVVVLSPAPSRAPDSSLVHMCAAFVRAFGEAAAEGATYIVDDDVIDLTAFDERASVALRRGVPMLVLGTSFAFVHFLDGLGDATFRLPRGSRVVHTGGFKGKSREVAPEKLRAEIARVFHVDLAAVVAEYGMTELSSQFYEKTLFDGTAPHDVFAEPPWARVVPVDPETLEPVADGEVGLAKIIDLLNVDSAAFVLTHDRVRRVEGGFALLGRAPGAPPRGCSIAIDELLGGANGEP